MNKSQIRQFRVQPRLSHSVRVFLLCAVAALAMACGNAPPRQSDLPKQPDRWVNSITLDPQSKVDYIGKTTDYAITSVTKVKAVAGVRTISVGDEIEGLRIGAIKCSYYWRDASYAGEQYMWRDRWGCQAGRSRPELENLVGDDGSKRFDYIHASPVQRVESN